jgi:hypothetical protein
VILYQAFDELSEAYFLCKNIGMEDEIEIPIVTDYRDILKFLEGIENGSISEHVSAIPAVSRPYGADKPIPARPAADGSADK